MNDRSEHNPSSSSSLSLSLFLFLLWFGIEIPKNPKIPNSRFFQFEIIMFLISSFSSWHPVTDVLVKPQKYFFEFSIMIEGATEREK